MLKNSPPIAPHPIDLLHSYRLKCDARPVGQIINRECEHMTQEALRIHEENEEEFSEMSYSLVCEFCDKSITTFLLASDFITDRRYQGALGDKQIESMFEKLVKHNLTHLYVPTR